jgi:hypothetical protein
MGVSESSTHAGVYGFNDFGGAAVTGEVQDGGGYGVHGMTSSDTKAAVFGENAGTGAGVTGSGPSRGVHGTSSGGIGVLADGATALQVNGPAVFSRSGLVTIASGQTSGKVTNVALTSASLVLAAVQAKGPSYVKQVALQPSTSSFTVYVNKTRTDTPVAWFIVN